MTLRLWSVSMPHYQAVLRRPVVGDGLRSGAGKFMCISGLCTALVCEVCHSGEYRKTAPCLQREEPAVSRHCLCWRKEKTVRLCSTISKCPEVTLSRMDVLGGWGQQIWPCAYALDRSEDMSLPNTFLSSFTGWVWVIHPKRR